MQLSREWAMPSKHTFTIAPIAALLRRYVSPGSIWADPFAGFNSPARYRNDLNPDTPAPYHLQAAEFAKLFPPDSLDGVLFDPPYSPRQISECYRGIGLPVGMKDTQSALLYSTVKDSFAPAIKSGGVAICCGWNSVGFGKARGFEMVELLTVCHGGAHNDTIVTVERKT